ncbi:MULTISPECIES: hypothetical protein [unclassified Streptomyces]|uniref:hypothetical protein n=1 Tax=unclassified Streptomyces TaxID=2593676 RepID=UPI0022571C09|nr:MULTISPECIES: hypothetical protein [unclassified Streptomyces]MCX5443708.1 hypothetical protein [Streptomyces sp. NBC_00063]WUB99090.1 hypothetical protein OHO83_46270 [Streptomyces sp. NBC_00569]
MKGDISAAANANLYFGAPALAFVTYSAASASSRYLRLLERLDTATITCHPDLGHHRQPAPTGNLKPLWLRPVWRTFTAIHSNASFPAQMKIVVRA